MGDSDGLFDAADLEHVEPVEAGVEVGAGVNKRFRAFEPHAVMLVPPSLDEWLPQTHLSRFIADVVETQLDLSKFYASYGKAKGQPPYDTQPPAHLVRTQPAGSKQPPLRPHEAGEHFLFRFDHPRWEAGVLARHAAF